MKHWTFCNIGVLQLQPFCAKIGLVTLSIKLGNLAEMLLMCRSWIEAGLHLCAGWGLCALRHGIQNSMEAILACHPARSTEWLDCHPKSCELWRIRTGPIGGFEDGFHKFFFSSRKHYGICRWLMSIDSGTEVFLCSTVMMGISSVSWLCPRFAQKMPFIEIYAFKLTTGNDLVVRMRWKWNCKTVWHSIANKQLRKTLQWNFLQVT